MTSSIHYFHGPVFWAKLHDHNVDPGFDNNDPNAQLELEMDKDQLKALKASGSRLQPKLIDDGSFRVKFKRKLNSKYPEYGGLPVVIDQEGTPFKELIGNGSECTIKVSVYDTKLGKGTRLESVRVDKHVVYEDTGEGREPVKVDTTYLEGVPF